MFPVQKVSEPQRSEQLLFKINILSFTLVSQIVWVTVLLCTISYWESRLDFYFIGEYYVRFVLTLQ